MELDTVNPAGRLKSLEEENARLKENLDECKAHILELNRQDNRFTDRDARKQYIGLLDCIEDWLDDFLGRDGRYCGWEKRLQVEQFAKRFSAVGIPKSLFPLDPVVALPGAISWLNDQRCCDRFMLSLVIWQFLEQAVFNDDLPFGTRGSSRRARESRQEDDGVFIDGVYKVMVGVEPSSNRVRRAGKWKSETLTAMIQTSRFHDRQIHAIKKAAGRLEDELRSCVLGGNREELSNFCRQCVKLAAELQAELRSCSSLYVREFPPLREPFHNISKGWDFRSINTWRSTTNGPDVRLVKALIPGLYRKTANEEGSESIEVFRPIMIVHGENEGQRSRRPSQSTSSPLSRASKSSARPKHSPAEESKGQKPGFLSSLPSFLPSSRSKKTGTGVPSSDERGARLRSKEDAGAGRRATYGPYDEGDPDSMVTQQGYRRGDSAAASRGTSPASRSSASQQSLAQQWPETMYEDNRAQTWPGGSHHGRDCVGGNLGDDPAGRERPQYHNSADIITMTYSDVATSGPPRKVAM